MYYRLGLDIGTNSIGWAMVELAIDKESIEPCGIVDMGVRIFPDGREPATTDKKTQLPKIGESCAVARRIARGMRRTRDRRIKRLRRFADRLVQFSLAPECGERNGEKIAQLNFSIDPYVARAKAASEKVSKEELARALFHLCKRRGFLSNRKTDGDDKDVTELKGKMLGLAALLEQRNITLGQYFLGRKNAGKHLRFRGEEFDETDSGSVAIYPTRAMYRDEFEAIRKEQGNIHLTDEQWDELFSIFTYQRDLLPAKVGLCSFEHGEDGREKHSRASRHLPVSHTFRIVQEVNNLRYIAGTESRDLTTEERQLLYDALEKQKSLTFSKMRTLLKVKGGAFNMESERRKNLVGNATACDMREIFNAHNSEWDSIDSALQNDIVEAVLNAKDTEQFFIWNRENEWNLPSKLVQALSKKYYASSHGHISRCCMEKLLPTMLTGKPYWEAARDEYGDHTDYSQFATGEVLEKGLPYYGEILRGVTAPVRETASTPEEERTYGKIANPTVHVALNQLRKLVNRLIMRYGLPQQIHLELARELKVVGKSYKELLKKLGENTKKNEERKKILMEKFPDQAISGMDMVKLRLWEELGECDIEGGTGSMSRTDVYTGRPISLHQLLSDQVEIEHILPYSRTYDNSMVNKTVTFREVNRRKGNSLPYDFACADSDVISDEMAQRALRLPRGKRWRFQKDAADIYERILTKNMTAEERKAYDADSSGSFIDRQLVDTQYISRIAARYLVPLVGTPSRVVPVNGQITNLLRNKWGINIYKAKGEKGERQDHRHHAEDALIVALTSRSLLKRIADETRSRQEQRQDYSAKLIFPQRPAWATDDRIKHIAGNIHVSFKPDHSREARLYADTAYGILPDGDKWKKDGYDGVVRRSITALKENEVAQIRDDAVRSAVVDFLHGPAVDGIKKWENKLAKLAQTPICIGSASKPTRVRRVRIVIKNQSIQPIPSAPYKGYAVDSLAFCDIWQTPKYNKKGKATGKWGYVGKFISYAEAKRYEGNEAALHADTKPHPAARKIMRVYKNDLVLLTNIQGEEKLMRVAGFSASDNRLDIRPHTESGGKQIYKAIPVLIEQLSMRKVHVSLDGVLKK